MLLKRHFLALTLLLVALAPSARSQTYFNGFRRENPYLDYQRGKENGWDWMTRFYQKFYLGVQYPVVPLHLNLQYSNTFKAEFAGTAPDQKRPDSSSSINFTCTKSWAVMGGEHFRLGKVGKTGAVVINCQIEGGYLQGESKDKSQSAQLMYMGLPISFEYKSGGEARLNKTQKSLFSIGAGVNPSFYTGSIYGSTGGGESAAGFVPFAKIELGYLAGVAFKLAATVNFATLNFEKYDRTIYFTDASDYQTMTELHGEAQVKPTVVLSLAVMPFSWDWSDDRWDY